MTQTQKILEAFRENNNQMTLGYILSHSWGYEFRARITELRRDGFEIMYQRGKRPSENLYTLIPKQAELLREAV